MSRRGLPSRVLFLPSMRLKAPVVGLDDPAHPTKSLLRQPLPPEHVVVVLGEAVGLVADVLQEA